MSKITLLIDTKYRHIKYTDGIDANFTCETLGLSSITTKSECYNAALKIDQLSSYAQYDEEPGCTNNLPNNCQSHTTETIKMIFFRDCAVQTEKTASNAGLICKLGKFFEENRQRLCFTIFH